MIESLKEKTIVEWLTKLIKNLEIPVKVILPAVWLFSGFLLFANQKVLERMNLIDWSLQNGFAFGLVFLISTCLIIVYSVYYIKSKVGKLLFKLNLNKRTIKAICDMSEKEVTIILDLYKSKDGISYIDFADPVIKGLISRKYIFIGNNVPVEVGWNNEMIVKGTLQPFVRRALKWEYKKIQKRIKYLEKKKRTSKNTLKIDDELTNLILMAEKIYRD